MCGRVWILIDFSFPIMTAVVVLVCVCFALLQISAGKAVVGHPIGAHNYSCPLYETIRKPSVATTVFQPADITGVWYLAATTELTTKFCLCNVMTYTVYTTAYRYTDTCFQVRSFCHPAPPPHLVFVVFVLGWQKRNARKHRKHCVDLMVVTRPI